MIIPMWMLIAKGAKALANSENSQIDALNRGSNSMNTNNNNRGIGNTLSIFSSIYSNYLNGNNDKKKLFMR